MKENYYNCIYMYTNKINNHKYIGQAKDFKIRHKSHLHGKKQLIDIKIKEYGIENFDIKILAENIIGQEKLNEYEMFFIKRYNTLVINGEGYNIREGGNDSNPMEGKTEQELECWKENISKTMKERYSENHWMKGRKLSEETKNKIGEASKGRHQTEDTKNKISKKHKGKVLTEEHKEKLSKAKDNKKSKIVSVDMNTNELEYFESITETKRKYNYNPTLVRLCCDYNHDKEGFVEQYGRTRKSAYNKKWYYLNDYNESLRDE